MDSGLNLSSHFSGTGRHTKLKLGKLVDSGLILSSHISQELGGIQVKTWETCGQWVEPFVTHFSGTGRHTKLKLGILVDSGLV